MNGRIRSIKPEWLEDELLAAASDEARVLSIALVLMADDYGRGRASLATIATTTWRHDFERDDGANAPETLARASRALRELVEMRFVVLYEVERQRYFAIRNWSKHQKVDKPSKARIPEPPSQEIQEITEIRETLARPSRVVPKTLAPDLDQDQDQDQDQEHIRRAEPDPTPPPKPSEPSPVQLVFDHWRSVMGKTQAAKLDDKRRRRCEWAIREYGLEVAKQAIDGCARSDFHMGRDPKSGGTPYNDLTLVFRDAVHFERFRDMAKGPANAGAWRPPVTAEAYAASASTPEDDAAALAALSAEDLARLERWSGGAHGRR